ncbi:hypothetical protein ACIGNX_02060 [Actinosynnema sp. NPDC053489]|uniref:hypothetical protein n=1 Tax=Actinosynnema sp. NPDC053489 TaxID=3363916 RepID=UPI0037CB6938
MLWLVGVVLAAVVVPGLWPTTADGYRETAVTGARDAASAVSTAALVGEAASRDRAFGGYTSAALSDAREGVGTALGDVADLEVPDEASGDLRDRVVPLLVEAVAAVGDVSRAADRSDAAATSTAARRARAAGERLRDFVGSAG